MRNVIRTPLILRPVLLLTLCAAIAVTSLAERLPIKTYTSADGLGSSFVDFLMRDSRGFMWFCTRDGLSRFDGSQFITYRIGDKGSPPGIESIYETRDGSYWVTTTGGLYRFKADAVSQPDKTSGGRPLLNAQYMGTQRGGLLQDHAGNLWYRSDDLYRVREHDGKIELEATGLSLPESQNQPLNIFQAREADDGCIWLNTNRGLVRRLPDGRVILYQHHTDLRLGQVSMIVDGDRVWVDWGSDFYVIKPPPLDSLPRFERTLILPLTATATGSTTDQGIRLPEKPGEILQVTVNVPNTAVHRLFRTADGHIWFTSGRELLEFDGHVFHTYGTAQGFPEALAEIAEDSAGNLWISGQSGLLRLDRRGLTTYGEGDGLNSSRQFAISEATDGTLYFANGDFYLSRLVGSRFQTVRSQIAGDARALWSSRYAYLSTANEWWILTATKLYRFAASNLQRPIATYDSNSGLKANEMFQIFEDSQGSIWLSQQPDLGERCGLYRLKRGEQKFYTFSSAEGLPAGKSASSFAEDRAGNLWFGFYEGGLARFANGRFTEFNVADGLPRGLIIDLLLDHQGRLWLASTSGGVSRIDDPTAVRPNFVSLTNENGLSSNNTRTLTEDKLGNIYVGTVRGVDRIAPATNRIKHYSVSDGLGADFVVDSHCDRNGVLWFATTNGLSRLIPTPDDRHPPPPIWLGGLRIAGVAQSIAELGENQFRTLELTHTQNNLQLDFFGLDFQAGEKLRYQYRLDGADQDWSVPTEQRTVTFANLQPGTYHFLVRAVNSNGLVSERPAVVSFRILPPIWLRWWFIALLVLLLGVMLYLFYRYRLARLREVNTALAEAQQAEEKLSRSRQERLAELERVRARIATDLHDDIGASLTQISILSEVARQQSMKGNGAGQEPLQSIANVSNELVDTMSDIVWAINPSKDHLQDLIQRMRRFASDILSARGIHFEFNAPELAPEIPLGANPRREVFLIFKESLTNIVKHSGATRVEVEFVLGDDKLTLQITDNGQGFDVGTKSSPSLFAADKGGHGILSMKKRAAEMNGMFEIKSEPGAGSVMKFQLPLDRSARSTSGRSGTSDA